MFSAVSVVLPVPQTAHNSAIVQQRLSVQTFISASDVCVHHSRLHISGVYQSWLTNTPAHLLIIHISAARGTDMLLVREL